MLLAECEAAIGETVNIGSNSEISIADLMTMISKVDGQGNHSVTTSRKNAAGEPEVFRLHCDNTKIIEMTNYAPKFRWKMGCKIPLTGFP